MKSSFLVKSQEPPKPKTAKTQKIQVEKPQLLIDMRDFHLSPIVDSGGIHILVKYLGQIVNTCNLPRNLYEIWLKSSPGERTSYVSAQISIQDAIIKKMIVNEIINVINRIFTRAR